MDSIVPSGERTSFVKKTNVDVLNVIHIGLSFLLIFMSFSVSEIFQTSSDHAREGAIALSILYGSYSLSSLFVSSYLTRLFSIKLTLILSSLTYVSFVGANIKFNAYILYLISCLLGIGSSLIWTAQGVYVSLSSIQYEIANGFEPSSKRGFFNGLFFCCFQLKSTIGFSIASLLFYFNVQQWLVFTTMTGIGLCGSISLIFLRNVETKHLEQKNQSIFSTISLFKEPKLLFLVPLICYMGFGYSYLFGVLPPMIVSKSLKYIIYASYGLINAISSLSFGKLSDVSHKCIYYFLFAGIIHLVVYLLLISIWLPPIDQNQVYIFFILILCLAVADGIFLPQMYSVLGTFFNDKRSFDIFTNFKLIQGSAIAIGFLYKNYFTFQTITYICISFLLVGMCLLIICHYGFYSIDIQNIDDDQTRIKLNKDNKDKTIPLTVESE